MACAADLQAKSNSPDSMDHQKTKESTLIVLSAPSIHDSYYKSNFRKIIDYMISFVNLVHGKDRVVILADADTISSFGEKIPDRTLIKADIEDIWIRDFAPVIPSRQVKFRYEPCHQKKSVTKSVDRSFRSWLAKNNIHFRKESNIILDGGNLVDNPDGSRIILTDRILYDNPQLTKSEAKKQLRLLLDADEVAIIPEIEGDTTGHADGMLMWVSSDKLLVQESTEPHRTKMLKELEHSFPTVEIIEIPDHYEDSTWDGFSSARNIFVNSIVTDRYIYMPTFNGPHDSSMLDLIQSQTDKTVVPIPAESICFMGGSVRCLSWQIKGNLKEKILRLVQ